MVRSSIESEVDNEPQLLWSFLIPMSILVKDPTHKYIPLLDSDTLVYDVLVTLRGWVVHSGHAPPIFNWLRPP